MDITEEAIRRFYIELGQKIGEVRRGEGMSQLNLATAVGVKRSSIANMEAGRQRSLIHVVALVAQALSVPISELIPQVPDDQQAGAVEISPSELEGQPGDTQDFIASAIRRATGGQP